MIVPYCLQTEQCIFILLPYYWLRQTQNIFPSNAVNEAVDDVKVKAVNEMMERIKHGVVLRPVKSQDTKVSYEMLNLFMCLFI